MTTFHVPDMTCGHCTGAITKAVRELDPQATVQCDLATHRVDVGSSTRSEALLLETIAQAGYTPKIVDRAAALRARQEITVP